MGSIRSLIKAQPDEELKKLQKLIEKNKELEKQVASLKEKVAFGIGMGMSAKGTVSSLEDDVQKIGDVSLLVKKLEGVDAKTLRSFIDNAKNQLQ